MFHMNLVCKRNNKNIQNGGHQQYEGNVTLKVKLS